MRRETARSTRSISWSSHLAPEAVYTRPGKISRTAGVTCGGAEPGAVPSVSQRLGGMGRQRSDSAMRLAVAWKVL